MNVKKDGTYSFSAAHSVANAGGAQPIIFRGYNSVIGDGYLGRTGGNGALITTNMPVITYTSTGRISTTNSNIIFENLNISRTGTGTSALVTGAVRSAFKDCVISDATSGAAASVFSSLPLLLNCDVASTQSAGGTCWSPTTGGKVVGCRLTAPNGSCVSIGSSIGGVAICDTVFHSSTTGVKVVGTTGTTANNTLILNCTGYAITGNFLELPNNATSAVAVFPNVFNCHITDCGAAFNSLYSGTANVPGLFAYNRTRDNGADAGFGDWPLYGAITTDTGGAATDYTNAGSGDFSLISGAPGRAAGILPYGDVGAIQAQASSGGVPLIFPGRIME